MGITTMCYPILHLMVALYRRFQILLPSLGTLWMVTQERGMIPLCAHLMFKEALVVFLRQLQVRNHCPRVCFVWSQKVTFRHSQDCAHIEKKSTQRRSSQRIMRTKSSMTCSNLIFPQALDIFKYFPDSIISSSSVNPSA